MTRSDRASGQTLALISLFMFAVLGMCALAIDVGVWYQQRQSAQAAADSSALAGAAFLPTGWSPASNAAAAQFAKNKIGGDTATYSRTTTFIAGDTITVVVHRTARTYFARIFGTTSVAITTPAKATLMNSGGGVMPWGVMKGTYIPGTSYPIYTDNSGPNNGAIRVPAWDTASSTCTANTVNGLGGSSLYTAEIRGGIVTTCALTIGQVLNTKTGNNTGPTSQGIDNRCPTLQPASSIVSFAGSPPTIIQPASCQLVLLPVLEDAATGAATWPKTGSGDVRVIGFSWWVITDYANGGKIVNAVYVGDAETNPNPTNSLPPAYHPQLTG